MGSAKDDQMNRDVLASLYRSYISCLNAQDWANLGQFVGDEVHYNDQQVGLAGYRTMLEEDFAAIPDLHFSVRLLVSDPPYVASCL